jgi:hypothetical protein
MKWVYYVSVCMEGTDYNVLACGLSLFEGEVVV